MKGRFPTAISSDIHPQADKLGAGLDVLILKILASQQGLVFQRKAITEEMQQED